jgi:hypothetical protein
MKITHLGGGTVLFDDAMRVPQEKIIPYLDELKNKSKNENFTYVYGEDGEPLHAINSGGFIYNLELAAAAPVRIQDIEHRFFKECDDAIYSALLEYIEIFPSILQCLWWKSGGHVLCYDKGGRLGFHADNDINYRYGSQPKTEHATRNVISALVYLNDCVEGDDEDRQFSFSGGHMTVPYFDIDIKPRAGSIVMMPASYIGAHEIHEVTRGSRYSYLSWFAQGSPDPDRGINPMVEKEWINTGGQWWLDSIIEDYEAHILSKYPNKSERPRHLLNFRTRDEDHK